MQIKTAFLIVMAIVVRMVQCEEKSGKKPKQRVKFFERRAYIALTPSKRARGKKLRW